MPRRTIPSPVRASTGPTRFYVVPTPAGWQILREGSSKASRSYATQDEAVRAARAKLRKSGGELRIKNSNGRSTDSYTLGLSAMTKLAAVEGISFTPAMKRKIKAAQDPTLSSDERRKILAGARRKARR